MEAPDPIPKVVYLPDFTFSFLSLSSESINVGNSLLISKNCHSKFLLGLGGDMTSRHHCWASTHCPYWSNICFRRLWSWRAVVVDHWQFDFLLLKRTGAVSPFPDSWSRWAMTNISPCWDRRGSRGSRGSNGKWSNRTTNTSSLVLSRSFPFSSFGNCSRFYVLATNLQQ